MVGPPREGIDRNQRITPRKASCQSLSGDQISHSPGRPQRSAIAQRLGTFLQTFAQFLQLGRLQAGFAARSPGLLQRLGSMLFPSLIPPTDRLAVNAQSSRDLALMDASIKKSGGFEPPPFQFIKIAFDTFWISHARKLTREIGGVTILCECQ